MLLRLYSFGGCTTLNAVIDTLLLTLTHINHSFCVFSMNTVLGSTIGSGMYFPSGHHWMAMFTGCASYYIDLWNFGFIIFPI